MIKKFIIKKELNLELRNNTSLFLITPTMCVLIIVFPILSENRFRVENDMFVIVQLLFLIIFTTLFSVYFIARLLTVIYVIKNKEKVGLI